MPPFTLNYARDPAQCLFECVTGSRAYGTDTPESDTDIRGIFVLPRERLFGLPRSQVEQVSDDTNDRDFLRNRPLHSSADEKQPQHS